MQAPLTPSNESERLSALRALKILDTPQEERFDRLTRLVQHVMQVPIALVSLVDENRQWFKSRQGLEACETGRDISFCGHAIHTPGIFCIPDALLDKRFADNPLVTGPPNIRFYAGAALEMPDGARIGTLCAIDSRPHEPTDQQLAALRDLARCVVDEMGIQPILDIARQLRDGDERLNTIVDTVVDGIITIDQMGTIETANPAAVTLFGYPIAELMGRNVNMLMPEPYHSAHDEYLRHYGATHQAKIIGIGREVAGRRADGTVFPMELSVGEMKLQGRTMFVGVVRDISERKKIERLKSEFVSTVSHELRTPLTSISGALSLVLGKLALDMPPKARQLLETASRNCERLNVIINDILDLEKIESGSLAFDFAHIDLLQIIRQSVAANESYAERLGVSVSIKELPAHAHVRADANRLLQVMANLISNAVKFSAKGGIVEVSAIDLHDRFRVLVRDHGRGIPETFRERIFQRFAQADSSDTREKGGTGLGLSITKVIVEKHGGNIDFESELGQGTTFFFDLPATEVAAPKHTGASHARVLICDDNLDVGAVLSELLSREGIESDLATTGQAAIAMVKRYAYRALLLDLGLPDMDGLSLIHQLREDAPDCVLPIIVISGRAESEHNRWEGDSVAVLDWLQKPVDFVRLRAALRLTLAGGETSSRRKPRILHVEDDLDVIQIAQSVLEEAADYTHATSLAQARQRLAEMPYDLVLLDIGLTDGSGLDLINDVPATTQIAFFSGSAAPREVSGRVTATLTKGGSSTEQLLALIKNLAIPVRESEPCQK